MQKWMHQQGGVCPVFLPMCVNQHYSSLMKGVWRSTMMCCHENKQQPKLRTHLAVKSQRCNFFISLLCVSVFGCTGNRTENIFPWVPWRNMHLTVQEICALSRDFTGYYFLLLPEMSQCQWRDEAMSIKQMWLRSALGHVYIINKFLFANYYISARSLLITRHTNCLILPSAVLLWTAANPLVRLCLQDKLCVGCEDLICCVLQFVEQFLVSQIGRGEGILWLITAVWALLN